MRNPMRVKNPFMSVWLSSANKVMARLAAKPLLLPSAR